MFKVNFALICLGFTACGNSSQGTPKENGVITVPNDYKADTTVKPSPTRLDATPANTTPEVKPLPVPEVTPAVVAAPAPVIVVVAAPAPAPVPVAMIDVGFDYQLGRGVDLKAHTIFKSIPATDWVAFSTRTDCIAAFSAEFGHQCHVTRNCATTFEAEAVTRTTGGYRQIVTCTSVAVSDTLEIVVAPQ